MNPNWFGTIRAGGAVAGGHVLTDILAALTAIGWPCPCAWRAGANCAI